MHAGGREYKLFIFVDVVLAVIADGVHSLLVLLDCIDSYSKLSGCKINWHKSEGMSISCTCHSKDIALFNFKQVPSSMKYLGYHLNPNLEDIIDLNMEPLLCQIKNNLNKWGKLKLNL